MAISIVPIAGPDLVEEDGTIKSLKEFNERPQLEAILKSRPWYKKTNTYIFVMQNNSSCKLLYENHITKWLKNTKSIYIEEVVNGALMSCIGGTCFVKDYSEPIVIDLGDIFFESKLSIEIEEYFKDGCKAYVPCFSSQREKYSYIEVENGRLIRVMEKKVISNNATCGVYAFKNIKELLNAIAWYSENADSYRLNNLDYVAPILNYFSNTSSIKIEKYINIIDPN